MTGAKVRENGETRRYPGIAESFRRDGSQNAVPRSLSASQAIAGGSTAGESESSHRLLERDFPGLPLAG